MKKVYILASLALLGQSSLSFAQIREYQTTRLNSSAGAGVASILALESAILNPAGAAFFQEGNASYQLTTTTLRHKDSVRDTNGDKFPNNNRSQAAFVSDYSGSVKGGVSYINQKENEHERTRLGINAATSSSESSAVGISYRYTTDKLPSGTPKRHKVFHEMVLGMLQIIDNDTSVGLVVVDPTRSNEGNEKVIGGFQYRIAKKFTIIGDFAYRYTGAISKDYGWNGAVQLNLFDDFFIRGGQFYDNITYYKGTGYGLTWIGPRMGVEFAQKFSEATDKNTYVYRGETIVDTSLSALIKF